VALAGVVGAGIPTVCFIGGIRLLGAPRAAILATLEPVVGVGLAALLLGERPTIVQLLGGVLIIAAGVLLQLRAPDEVAEHEAFNADAAAGESAAAQTRSG
jgi:drug/metabolite transporter (DMT)-like permease